MRGGADHFSKEWTGDTLWSVFARQAAARPGAPALIDDGGTTTYGALAARVERAARGLARLGIGTGDVVSVQLPNTADFLVVYLALARLGAVLSTIHMP